MANPTANTTVYTKPSRSDLTVSGEFNPAEFNPIEFNITIDTYTTYTKPTANTTAYTNPLKS